MSSSSLSPISSSTNYSWYYPQNYYTSQSQSFRNFNTGDLDQYNSFTPYESYESFMENLRQKAYSKTNSPIATRVNYAGPSKKDNLQKQTTDDNKKLADFALESILKSKSK